MTSKHKKKISGRQLCAAAVIFLAVGCALPLALIKSGWEVSGGLIAALEILGFGGLAYIFAEYILL